MMLKRGPDHDIILTDPAEIERYKTAFLTGAPIYVNTSQWFGRAMVLRLIPTPTRVTATLRPIGAPHGDGGKEGVNMSMDNPNEYETALEEYANAVRDENEAAIAAEDAREHHRNCSLERQRRWRTVATYRAEGKIKPGVYRLNGPHGLCEALVIESHADYPELRPMFR